MNKTKQDYLKELVMVAYKIDDKLNKQEEITKQLQQMASLAREGKKNCEEYKQLDIKYRHPTVIDFGAEMQALRKIVKYLKRYQI